MYIWKNIHRLNEKLFFFLLENIWNSLKIFSVIFFFFLSAFLEYYIFYLSIFLLMRKIKISIIFYMMYILAKWDFIPWITRITCQGYKKVRSPILSHNGHCILIFLLHMSWASYKWRRQYKLPSFARFWRFLGYLNALLEKWSIRSW